MHKLFSRFLDFKIFNCNFVKIVVPPSNKNENYLAHLKGQSLLKINAENGIKINTKSAQSIPPRTNSTPALKHDQKQDMQTPYFCTYSRHAFPKLCMVIKYVEAIKKVQSLFDPTYSFSYRVHKKIDLNDRRAASQQQLCNMCSESHQILNILQDNGAHKIP